MSYGHNFFSLLCLIFTSLSGVVTVLQMVAQVQFSYTYHLCSGTSHPAMSEDPCILCHNPFIIFSLGCGFSH